MKYGLAFLAAWAIVGAEALAKLRGSVRTRAMGRVLGWAAGGTQTDRDSGSERRMVQRVRALHHSTALGRVTQTERGGRARHLEYIKEDTHIWSRDLHIIKKHRTRHGENRHAETK